MILSLIDYSKCKAQEANFKFWDDLNLYSGAKLTHIQVPSSSVSVLGATFFNGYPQFVHLIFGKKGLEINGLNEK